MDIFPSGLHMRGSMELEVGLGTGYATLSVVRLVGIANTICCTADEIGKKMNQEKRVQSGCPKASNPYHECNENCQKTILKADSGAIRVNSVRKKKLGSKPELPVLDNIPA